MSFYEGLGAYAAKAPKHPTDRKPGESDMAYERRMNVIRHHLENQVEGPTWEAHRQQVDTAVTGSNVGIFGQSNAAASLDHPHDSGVQRPDRLGHVTSPSVPGSVSIPRIFVQDIKGEQPVRHLTTGTSSGQGWH